MSRSLLRAVVAGVCLNLSSAAWAGWHVVSPAPTAADLNGVAWTGSQFIAVGTGGTILTSPDGAAWTTRTSGTGGTLNAVVWHKDKAVVIGDGGVILTSPDGVVWSPQTSGITVNLTGLASNGQQVIAASGGIRSADGMTWVACGAQGARVAAQPGGGFLMPGAVTGSTAPSAGSDWTPILASGWSNVYRVYSATDVVYFGAQWLAGGWVSSSFSGPGFPTYTKGSPAILTPRDSFPPPENSKIWGLVVGPTFGYPGPPYLGEIQGPAWPHTSAELAVAGGTLFGFSGGAASTSTNATDWTQRLMPAGFQPRDGTAGVSLIVLVGQGGIVTGDGSLSAYEQWAFDHGLVGYPFYPDSDPDEDGLANVAEYAFGTGPLAENQILEPAASYADGELDFEFPYRAASPTAWVIEKAGSPYAEEWATVANREPGSPWTTVPGYAVTVNGAGDKVSLHFHSLGMPAVGFFRLSVILRD